MADLADPTPTQPSRKGLLRPVLIGVLLAALAGGGGFWAVTSGPFAPVSAVESGAATLSDTPPTDPGMARADVAFVPLETLIVSLGPDESGRHLIFTAELEVAPAHLDEVTRLSPRVLDVLNSYLRVVGIAELSDPTSLARLRAQMLRRVQVVTGTGRVLDLLITQFVVN